MNLNSKIEEAVNRMRCEYGNHIDQVSIDLVAAEIRQQHQLMPSKNFKGHFGTVGNCLAKMFSNVTSLMTGHPNCSGRLSHRH